MINKKKNIFENINFKAFSSQICEVMKDAFEKFWEQDVQISLQAVNDFREIRQDILIKNIDFFSSQIKVENHKPIVVRLSKDFVENFLEISLGDRTHPFRLTKLSSLEIKILNTFGEFIYKKLKDILIPVKDAKLSDKSEKNINLIFMFMTKNEICSKVMISIPMDRINLAPVKKSVSFKDEDFLTSSTVVGLRVGSSKLTLEELQNLSKDDIVVLEDSDLSKVTLISGEVEKRFNIKIKSSLIVDLDGEDEEENENIQKYNEVKMEKNLWDDIQIEVNAEFEKVKMTIGELKQITQGQIVDLGSVFENEISLFVEDKKVAKGELIIINDRYAVRLNEIINSSTQTAPIKANMQPQGIPAPSKVAQKPAPAAAKPMPKQAQPQKPALKPQVKPNNDEEEFDYSDFEK